MAIIGSLPIEEALIKHGLIPPEARLIELVIEVHATPRIRYETLLTVDQCATLAQALADAADAYAAAQVKP